MKMSDVFDLPLKVDGVSLADKGGIQVSEWGFEGDTLDAAAVNAINSHDALVELNMYLTRTLMACLGDLKDMDSPSYTLVVEALNEAKELLKEQGE